VIARFAALCAENRAPRASVRAVLAVCAGAVIAAGCGSSSSSSKLPPSAAITRASYVSSAASGYRVVMNLHETVPNAGQITITGTGSFAVPAHSGSMTMQLSVPSAASAGLGNLQMQAVFVPGTIYMKLPPQLAARIPGGKPWIQINLSQLGKAAGIPGLSSLVNSSSSLNDPGQYLDFLRVTANGTATDVGPTTVGGVSTTHYHAIIDLSKLPNAVPASSRPAVQQLVNALRSRGATAQMPIDAYIDSSHLIRRIVLSYQQPLSASQTAAVLLQMDFVGYGPQPPPTVPPASQTVNLLALTGGHP
jgi:hypothetical protein